MSHDNSEVSVIIPVYNTEKYLRECLDSVVNQTLRDIEIICIDDGSTDHSGAILEEYEKADSRITVISLENQGQAAARNCGMRCARGKYIYFLDSDDYIEINALEILARLAEENDADSVHFASRPFYESEELHRNHSDFDQYFDMKDLSGIYSGPEYIRTAEEKCHHTEAVGNVFWRRSLFLDNRIEFINGIIHEDVLFVVLADLASKRVVALPTVLHHYRIRSDSTVTLPKTHRNVIGSFRAAITLLERGLAGSDDSEAAHELRYAYSKLINDTIRRYGLLPPEERAKVIFEKEIENELFLQLIANRGEHLEQAAKQLQFDLDCVHASVSYRIGRAITWVPRKVRGGVRCYREHGAGYTLRRALYHVGLWKDEKHPKPEIMTTTPEDFGLGKIADGKSICIISYDPTAEQKNASLKATLQAFGFHISFVHDMNLLQNRDCSAQSFYFLTECGEVHEWIHEVAQARLHEMGVADRIYFYNSESNRIIKYQKPILEYLEYHVSWHCNLKCRGCAHYSNLFDKPLFGNPDQFRKHMLRLRELFDHIERVRLLGGEPFLNSQIGEFVKAAKEVFPDTDLRVVSNGLLIPRLGSDVLEILRRYGVTIDISTYPPTAKAMDKISRVLTDAGISFSVSPEIHEFRYIAGSKRTKRGSQTFRHCPEKICHFLHDDGRLSMCGIPIFYQSAKDILKTKRNLSDSDWIDLYRVKDGYEVLKRFSEAIPFCDYCVDFKENVFFPWQGNCAEELLEKDLPGTGEPSRG